MRDGCRHGDENKNQKLVIEKLWYFKNHRVSERLTNSPMHKCGLVNRAECKPRLCLNVKREKTMSFWMKSQERGMEVTLFIKQRT